MAARPGDASRQSRGGSRRPDQSARKPDAVMMVGPNYRGETSDSTVPPTPPPLPAPPTPRRRPLAASRGTSVPCPRVHAASAFARGECRAAGPASSTQLLRAPPGTMLGQSFIRPAAAASARAARARVHGRRQTVAARASRRSPVPHALRVPASCPAPGFSWAAVAKAWQMAPRQPREHRAPRPALVPAAVSPRAAGICAHPAAAPSPEAGRLRLSPEHSSSALLRVAAVGKKIGSGNFGELRLGASGAHWRNGGPSRATCTTRARTVHRSDCGGLRVLLRAPPVCSAVSARASPY